MKVIRKKIVDGFAVRDLRRWLLHVLPIADSQFPSSVKFVQPMRRSNHRIRIGDGTIEQWRTIQTTADDIMGLGIGFLRRGSDNNKPV